MPSFGLRKAFGINKKGDDNDPEMTSKQATQQFFRQQDPVPALMAATGADSGSGDPWADAPQIEIARLSAIRRDIQSRGEFRRKSHPEVGKRYFFKLPIINSRTGVTKYENVKVLLTEFGPVFIHPVLKSVDTVVFIDDSPSMGLPCHISDEQWKKAGHYQRKQWMSERRTRWESAEEVFTDLTPTIVENDEDGMDMYCANQRSGHPDSHLRLGGGYYKIKTPREARARTRAIEKPLTGNTPICSLTKDFLEKYMADLEAVYTDPATKGQFPTPVNIIVITDGIPNDPEMLVQSIIDCANKLEEYDAPPTQVGIQMLQVGKDGKAAELLKRIDNLKKNGFAKRDIADTRSYEEMSADGDLSIDEIFVILLASLMKRIDGDNDSE